MLKKAGLVVDQASGNRRIYSVNPEAMAELERYAQSFLVCGAHPVRARVRARADRADPKPNGTPRRPEGS
jgi:hypothetical protein